METAGKLVDDEELAEAMKERGLGTPATRADTIDGLIYQKYMDRNQRELVPTAKAEQLLQFLEAVKADRPHEPGHDRRVGTSVAPDGAAGNFRARNSWPRSSRRRKASSSG